MHPPDELIAKVKGIASAKQMVESRYKHEFGKFGLEFDVDLEVLGDEFVDVYVVRDTEGIKLKFQQQWSELSQSDIEMIQYEPGDWEKKVDHTHEWTLGFQDLMYVTQNWESYGPIEAVRKLQDIVDRSPHLSVGWGMLGKSCLNAGQAEQSRVAFERAINLDPDHPSWHLGLSNLYLEAMFKDKGLVEPRQQFGYVSLQVLGCTYEYAREKAIGHAKRVLDLTQDHDDGARRGAQNTLEFINKAERSGGGCSTAVLAVILFAVVVGVLHLF